MNLINRVVLKLEKYEKCEMICDSDCPLGQLYDYSCALQDFIMTKMKEVEEMKKVKEQAEIPAEAPKE